jgi:hypothetical protein
MKLSRFLAAALLAVLALPALAQYSDSYNYNYPTANANTSSYSPVSVSVDPCNPSQATSTSNSTAAGGNQRQQQANNSTNTNTVAGGAGGAGGTGGVANVTVNAGGSSGAAGSGGGGNLSVSNTNVQERTTVWAPVIHGQAAAPLAAANMIVTPMACGPRVRVVRRPVMGKRFGVLGGQSDVEQGEDDDIEPADQPFVEIGGKLFGHQVTQYAAILGTSSSGSFSLGGYGSSGNGAQGGAAQSGQLQQISSRFYVRDCLMAVAEPTVKLVEAKPIRE